VQLGIEIAKTFTFVTSVWPRIEIAKMFSPFVAAALLTTAARISKKKNTKSANSSFTPAFTPCCFPSAMGRV